MLPDKFQTRSFFAVAFLSLLLFQGCGYHLVGKGSNLPGHIKTIAVPPLKSEVENFDLEQRMTEGITDEFVRRGQYKITSDMKKADAVLKGTIVDFSTKAISFDSQSRATRYEITVSADVSFRDLKEGTVIWENSNFTFREEYKSSTNLEDYYNREIEAIQKLSQDFAESLVASITQGF